MVKMIEFIFVITILVMVLLLLAFILENYILGMMSAFGMIIIGIYILINGIQGMNNILTNTIAVITLGLGMWISLEAPLKEIGE